MKLTAATLVIFAALSALDGALWFEIGRGAPPAAFAALDVGQGDSTLLRFANGATVLVDAGPPGSGATLAVEPLITRQRIDLAVITHPQLDHFGGLARVLERYDVGAVITNGREPDEGDAQGAWKALMEKLDQRKIPRLALRTGDRIRIGNEGIVVLSPNALLFGSGELNDTGLVLHASLGGLRALLAADVGTTVENHLRQTVSPDMLRVDILKVGHHGSKYSTSEAFLAALQPKVALIEVGARNTYHHPTPETLLRLRHVLGERIFRTDTDGTVILTHPAQDILRIRMARGDILEEQ